MSAAAAAALLRAGLLEGRKLALAHAASDESVLCESVREVCEGLGANVYGWPCLGAEDVDADAEAERLLAEAGALDVLVVDLAGAFAALPGTPTERLVRCMDSAWSVTRTVAASAFLAGADATPRGGRVIYVAPATGAGAGSGEHADAVRAAAENLARTLSIEWARFAVTTVAIAPGAASAAEDLAALIAYLASDAGAYFSGCPLDLRGV